MYKELCSYDNLSLAFKKGKKGKTKKRYVKRFGRNLEENLMRLRRELLYQTYFPCKHKTFILRDPKTRKISKSAFCDRVVHHALGNLIVPILEKGFIYDSHANQIGKGTHKALERFEEFKGKVSKNYIRRCYVLKADIKHYFEEINHDILVKVIKRKIKDRRVIWLIRRILGNKPSGQICGEGEDQKHFKKGMPLGNLTSQFFANVYLNELDQFVKHHLKAKYYIRYVDDFVILHDSKEQLNKWMRKIDKFLKEKLKIELHPQKSKILKLDRGITFLGFRIFYHYKLLRKSNMNNFERKFNQMKKLFNEEIITREKAVESFEGWLAYASNANTYKYRKHLTRLFNKFFPLNSNSGVKNKKKHRNFIKKIDESKLEFSVQKTLFLFYQGKDIKQIAEKRKRKESTVWKHLIDLIEYNQISLQEVLPKDKIKKIINKIYSKKDTLKEIKNRLKNDLITYNEIACVLASIKSRKNKS